MIRKAKELTKLQREAAQDYQEWEIQNKRMNSNKKSFRDSGRVTPEMS